VSSINWSQTISAVAPGEDVLYVLYVQAGRHNPDALPLHPAMRSLPASLRERAGRLCGHSPHRAVAVRNNTVTHCDETVAP
jgi:hypothetical protein